MTPLPLFDYAVAVVERDSGLSSVAHHCETFLDAVRTEAHRLALERGQVTIDDLRAWANDNGLLPHHPNAWGAVFREPGWQCVGHAQSHLVTNHGREVKVWRLR